jgi:hypothetical protein
MNAQSRNRSKNNQKRLPAIVIFGTGQAGFQAMRKLAKRCRIIAFLDNSLQKQGRCVGRIPVLPPEKLSHLHYDWICLASIYRDEMARQLQDLGVPLYKLLDGSTSEWGNSSWPPPLSSWACRETILVGPRDICLRTRERLARNLNILGIHSRDAGRIKKRKAELFLIASPEPEIEFIQLTESGIPINAIEVLSPDFLRED